MTVRHAVQPLKKIRADNWSVNNDQPCTCLCFGFSQITLILPFLLMILHFSQIGLTDDLTFTANTPFHKLPDKRK